MLMLYPNLNESDRGDGRLDMCYKELCYKGTAVYNSQTILLMLSIM